MNKLDLGNGISVDHEPDWSGDAVLTFAGGTATLPATVVFQLLTNSVGGLEELDSKRLLSEVVQARRDFELLRRQAETFKRVVEESLIHLGREIAALKTGN